jgi:hypothetical protein
VAAFSDAAIAAIVSTGEYSDPAASRYLAETLIQRRNAIMRTWLMRINPLANPTIDAEQRLTFDNVVLRTGIATINPAYRLRWSAFDNVTRHSTSLGSWTTQDTPVLRIPSAPNAVGGNNQALLMVEVSTLATGYPAWERPVRVYLRARTPATWTIVGLER